jgi:hypothetical protein
MRRAILHEEEQIVAFMIARELSLLPLSGVRAAHHSLAQQ